MKKWKVAWVSKITGVHGEGEPIFKTLEDAERAVKKSNAAFPNLRHSAVMVDTKYLGKS